MAANVGSVKAFRIANHRMDTLWLARPFLHRAAALAARCAWGIFLPSRSKLSQHHLDFEHSRLAAVVRRSLTQCWTFCLAIEQLVEHDALYLFANRFNVRGDHKAVHIRNPKEYKKAFKNDALRWVMHWRQSLPA